MGKIVAIANQKGGVGKTTTAINLSACVSELGYKVLILDMDPQGNTTSGYGIDKTQIDYTVYEFLIEEELEPQILKLSESNVNLIPASIDLAGAEIELIGVEQREFLLKNNLKSLQEQYDYIFIDCPPSLNLLTINALSAADSILVPIQCEFYALEGLTQLINTINLVKQRLNQKLEIEGIVFTMYDSRTNLSNQVVSEVKKYLEDKTYETMIPRNVRLGEAPSYGEPITIYDTKSKGAESYRNLAAEFIKRIEKENKNEKE